jgi:hypothetical protein
LTFRDQGRFQEEEELEIQVLDKRVLGVEHPDTLTATENLASTFRDQGRLQQAEELQLQVLGAEHLDTLTAMENLAETSSGQDKL